MILPSVTARKWKSLDLNSDSLIGGVCVLNLSAVLLLTGQSLVD